MKIAFQVEGPIDRTVLVRLVNVILERDVQPVFYEKRTGGLAEVFRTLEKAVFSARSAGCRGVVVVVDADSSTSHDKHGPSAKTDCRYCAMNQRLPPIADRAGWGRFTYAIAVPVQAIEAWLLQFGHFVERRPPGRPQALDRKAAKRLLYGGVSPSTASVSSVLDRILPNVAVTEIETLAREQPSFADFRAAVDSWRDALAASAS